MGRACSTFEDDVSKHTQGARLPRSTLPNIGRTLGEANVSNARVAHSWDLGGVALCSIELADAVLGWIAVGWDGPRYASAVTQTRGGTFTRSVRSNAV